MIAHSFRGPLSTSVAGLGVESTEMKHMLRPETPLGAASRLYLADRDFNGEPRTKQGTLRTPDKLESTVTALAI